MVEEENKRGRQQTHRLTGQAPSAVAAVPAAKGKTGTPPAGNHGIGSSNHINTTQIDNDAAC
jgi:hypothetical protein